MKHLLCALLLLPCLALAGCANLPRDCDGATARIRQSKLLEAGSTQSQNFAAHEREKKIIEKVAKELGATVLWREGNALDLMREVEERELPVAAATVRDDSPFASRVGLSKPFFEEGETKFCIAVAPGENELLLRIDRAIEASKGKTP